MKVAASGDTACFVAPRTRTNALASAANRTIRVLAAHRAVIDGIMAFHQGRIVGTAGDSVLAEFPSAVEGVQCATEIHDAIKTRDDSLPKERRIDLASI